MTQVQQHARHLWLLITAVRMLITTTKFYSAAFFNSELAIGTVCIFFGGILTSGGGVGGGGVYIPVLVLILGLSPHVAVPISKVRTESSRFYSLCDTYISY
jgi:hypothetical protein